MESFGITEREYDSLQAVASFPGGKIQEIIQLRSSEWTRLHSKKKKSPRILASFAHGLRLGLQSCLQKGLIQILEPEMIKLYSERWHLNRKYADSLFFDYQDGSVALTTMGALILYFKATFFSAHGLGISYVTEYPKQGASRNRFLVHLYLKGREYYARALTTERWDNTDNIKILKEPHPIGAFWPNPQIIWPDAWCAELELAEP